MRSSLLTPLLLALVIAFVPAVVHGAPQQNAGLALRATPQIVDVGGAVVLTLTALQFPKVAYASVSFVSLHHGYSGAMPWRPNCSCFQIGVQIARRTHTLEIARAIARLRYGGHTVSTTTSFTIRGLSRNGKDFAPGGSVGVTGWVSDPQPVQREVEHFCVWVKTLDGLGVPGRLASYVVHFKKRTASWRGPSTDHGGVACALRNIGFAHAGYRVRVDIYAAGERTTAYFTPRR